MHQDLHYWVIRSLDVSINQFYSQDIMQTGLLSADLLPSLYCPKQINQK